MIATVLTMSSTSAPRDRSLTGLLKPLQHRADRDRAGAALHRLVRVVAGVEVREDQHRGPAGDFGVRHLGRRHGRVDGRVVLDRPVDAAGPALARAPVRLPSRTLSTSAPDPDVPVEYDSIATRGVDAELRGGARRRDRDVGQLLRRRVRDDRAVAVDQHPIGQAHQEDARHRATRRAWS